MTRLRALIADDEALARERVRTLLARRSDVEIAGEAADGRQTLQLAKSLKPSLLFLDVQMPELTGFEVLEKLPDALKPEVIFVTAYDQFALKAFEVHAVDYLLKPFTRARFDGAVDRCLQRRRENPATVDPRLLSLLETLRTKDDRLPVRDKDGVELIRTAEVDWLEGAGNYVKLHLGPREHLVRDTLKNLEERLDPRRFLRVHRSAIVNLDSIARFLPWFHGEYVVVLRDGTQLRSTRTYSEKLRSLLK